MPPNSPIISLDLASTTGWARLASGVIDHGSEQFHRRHGRKRLPDDHEGIVYLQFFQWLKVRIFEDKPNSIVYERPGHFASASAAFVALGLRGVLYQIAAHYNVPIVAYSPTAIKKWATGKGTADKAAMKLAAVRISGGELFADDNAADAYLMLKFHLSK